MFSPISWFSGVVHHTWNSTCSPLPYNVPQWVAFLCAHPTTGFVIPTIQFIALHHSFLDNQHLPSLVITSYHNLSCHLPFHNAPWSHLNIPINCISTCKSMPIQTHHLTLAIQSIWQWTYIPFPNNTKIILHYTFLQASIIMGPIARTAPNMANSPIPFTMRPTTLTEHTVSVIAHTKPYGCDGPNIL